MNADLIHDSSRQEELAANLVHDVFSTMLASDAWPDAEAADVNGYPVMAVVFFAGAWKGAVQLEIEAALAYGITAHLMSVPPPGSVDSDVRDAVGEMANMIAGNLKSALPPETVMSMPAVVAGSDFVLTAVGANQSTRMGFATPQGRFVVTLIQTPRA